jgi:UDP-N-acetylglucosamine/UDP-N-acetylgalactosamine diphosphorylase
VVQVSETAPSGLGTLLERFEAHGQPHVAAQLRRLSGEARERLATELRAVDPAALRRAFDGALRLAEGERDRLEPPEIVRLPEHGGDPAVRAEARARGHALLADGTIGALVVAGGQGTRLGFAGPKGAFPLGPVSRRSLFEQQAQKLRRAVAAYGRPLPWLVMTSHATDAACRALFARSGCFGLPPADVRFFRQGEMPAVDFEGRMLLEAPDRLARAPDGHGGMIPALGASGLLDELDDRGIRRLAYYQVDNPLVPILDPLFLGLHDLRGAEMSCKVLVKRTPEERAGTVGHREGRNYVIEYTEVDPWHRDQREAGGGLRFWAASIAIFVFDVAFLRRVADRAEGLLPYHASPKRIPFLGPGGARVVPDAPNGYKLERFVFDALPEARRAALLEVRRHEEYSPIKNRSGSESPETAREDLVACYHRWLRAEGIGGVAEGAWIELDESRVGRPEGVPSAALGPLTGADWILFGSRGNA